MGFFMSNALIIVDVQNDFMPGGALPVAKGDQVIPMINRLLQLSFDVKIATKDWHPPDHGSFAESYEKKTGEIVELSGIPQILWPKHCIQHSHGAEFAPGWDTAKIECVFYKGTDKNVDSYSAFFDNGHLKSTGLSDYLRKKNIEEIYIAGLATDYCVKYSVLDALQLGFKTFVIAEACRSVNLQPDDEAKAVEEMRKAGAHIITLQELT